MVNSFGAFGKLTCMGDFFSHNLDHKVASNWDKWTQNYMIELRASLGPRWDNCFMTAPIWRFSVCSGVLSDYAIYGVMMPSVDRVGRQFPLMISSIVKGSGAVFVEHLARTETFEKMEDLALMTLEEDVTKETFIDQLNELDGLGDPSDILITEIKNKSIISIAVESSFVANKLADNYILTKFKQPSIWSSVTNGGMKFLISDGLPNTEEMTNLYDNDSDFWKIQ